MKVRLIGILVFASAILVGCGEDPQAKSQDELVQKSIGMMNEIAENMENMVKDPTDANIKKRQDNLKNLADKLEVNAKKIEALPKSAQNRVDRKFKVELEQAEARMKKATKPFEGLMKN